MGHYVYKYVLNNEIIYIGKNDTTLNSRIKDHGKPGDNIPKDGWEDIKKSKIYYITLANKNMSDVVESELIRRYKPKYNIAKKKVKWSGLPFVEPKWEEYKEVPIEKKNVTKEQRWESAIINSYNLSIDAASILLFVVKSISDKKYITKKIFNEQHIIMDAPTWFEFNKSYYARRANGKHYEHASCYDSAISMDNHIYILYRCDTFIFTIDRAFLIIKNAVEDYCNLKNQDIPNLINELGTFLSILKKEYE